MYSAPTKEDISYDYFMSGAKKYVALDNEGALTDLEKAVKLNSNLESALGLLIIVLAEEAMLNYQSGQYDKALPHLNKLVRYVPDDKELRDIYNEVKSKLEEKTAGRREVVSSDDKVRTEFLEVWRNYLRIKSQGYSLRDRLSF